MQFTHWTCCGQSRAEAALWDQSLLASSADSCHPSVPSPSDNKRVLLCKSKQVFKMCKVSVEQVNHSLLVSSAGQQAESQRCCSYFFSNLTLLTNCDSVLPLWIYNLVTICAARKLSKIFYPSGIYTVFVTFIHSLNCLWNFCCRCENYKRGPVCKEQGGFFAFCFWLQPRWLLKH